MPIKFGEGKYRSDAGELHGTLGYNESTLDSVFGRTHVSYPPVWLALGVPFSSELLEFVRLATELGAPLEISASPGLFGMALSSVGQGTANEVPLVQNSTFELERATDSGHAADLVQAHLVETLSSLQRSSIEFYFIRSRIAFEEFQLAGAMEALEWARHEGHVRFFGLRVESCPASISNWQFHDAFDAVSVDERMSPEDQETLRRMAKSRRVGFLTRAGDSKFASLDSPRLVSVSSIQDLNTLAES